VKVLVGDAGKGKGKGKSSTLHAVREAQEITWLLAASVVAKKRKRSLLRLLFSTAQAESKTRNCTRMFSFLTAES